MLPGRRLCRCVGSDFGKEYDAIKFVCGKGFGKGVGVRHVDDSEMVIAVYGAFAFRYHHMVSGKGMLNPLFGNEIGITDQEHFHATAPVNIPLTGFGIALPTNPPLFLSYGIPV